jgi:hypothetical protein
MPRTSAYVSPFEFLINREPEGHTAAAGDSALAQLRAQDRRKDWPEFPVWLDLTRKAEAKYVWLKQHSRSLGFEAVTPHEEEASALLSAADALADAMEKRAIVTERHAAMLLAIAVAGSERGVNDMFAVWSMSDLENHCRGRRMAAQLLYRSVRQVVEDGILPEVDFALTEA